MCVSVLPVSMYVYHVMSGTYEGQKTVSDAKELELQKAVNRHMDAGSSNCWTFSLTCASFFLKPFYLFFLFF